MQNNEHLNRLKIQSRLNFLLLLLIFENITIIILY